MRKDKDQRRVGEVKVLDPSIAVVHSLPLQNLQREIRFSSNQLHKKGLEKYYRVYHFQIIMHLLEANLRLLQLIKVLITIELLVGAFYPIKVQKK